MGACLSSKKAANKVVPAEDTKPTTTPSQPTAEVLIGKSNENTPNPAPLTKEVLQTKEQPRLNQDVSEEHKLKPEVNRKNEEIEKIVPVHNEEKQALQPPKEITLSANEQKEPTNESQSAKVPIEKEEKKPGGSNNGNENSSVAADGNNSENAANEGSFSSIKGAGTPVLAKIEKIYSSTELGPESGERLGKNPKLPPILSKEKSKSEQRLLVTVEHEQPKNNVSLSMSQELPSERSKKVRADIQHINEEAIKHEFDDIEGRVNANHVLHNKLLNRVAAEELIEDKILTRGDVVASLAVVEQDVIKAHLSNSLSREDINLYSSMHSCSPGTSRQGSLELSATYTKEQLIEQSLLDTGAAHFGRKGGITSSRSAQDLAVEKSPTMSSLFQSSDLEFPRRRTSRLTPEQGIGQSPHTPPPSSGSRKSSYVPLMTSPLISSSRPDLGLNSEMHEATKEAEDAA